MEVEQSGAVLHQKCHRCGVDGENMQAQNLTPTLQEAGKPQGLSSPGGAVRQDSAGPQPSLGKASEEEGLKAGSSGLDRASSVSSTSETSVRPVAVEAKLSSRPSGSYAYP